MKSLQQMLDHVRELINQQDKDTNMLRAHVALYAGQICGIGIRIRKEHGDSPELQDLRKVSIQLAKLAGCDIVEDKVDG